MITEKGRIPETWKLARLKPIPKTSEKTRVENFRPISNLSSVSKLFERCLLNRITSSGIDVDGSNQHGFKPNLSTTTAAVELQSQIASALDRGKKCMIYSMDLSAAFDLIRPGIFITKALQTFPDRGIIHLVHDFITNRKAYVDTGQGVSSVFKFSAGCPQGSTLGPKVFNIYCNDLLQAVKDYGFLVTYADDSYVVVEADNKEELITKTKTVMKKHLEWLRSNGMVCNVSKTELMMMNEESTVTIDIEDMQINSLPEMKVLGILFDKNLNWSSQVSKAIKRTNRMLFGLKKIRRFLDVPQCKQVVTSFYYSVLYYGFEVWHHRHLASHLKRKIKSAHYRALRLIFGKATSRDQLDNERASPEELARYLEAKLAVKVVNKKSPTRLYDEMMRQAYSERRQPGRLQFFDTSKKMMGRQIFRNRLQQVSNQMKFQWLGISDDSLRTNLKKTFFSYYKTKVKH